MSGFCLMMWAGCQSFLSSPQSRLHGRREQIKHNHQPCCFRQEWTCAAWWQTSTGCRRVSPFEANPLEACHVDPIKWASQLSKSKEYERTNQLCNPTAGLKGFQGSVPVFGPCKKTMVLGCLPAVCHPADGDGAPGCCKPSMLLTIFCGML